MCSLIGAQKKAREVFCSSPWACACSPSLSPLFLCGLLLRDTLPCEPQPPWPPGCTWELQRRETTGLYLGSPPAPRSENALRKVSWGNPRAPLLGSLSLRDRCLCCLMSESWKLLSHIFCPGFCFWLEDKLIPSHSILARRKVNEWA